MFVGIRDWWLDKIFNPNLLWSVLDSLCGYLKKFEGLSKLKLGQAVLPKPKVEYSQIVEVHLRMHLSALLDHAVVHSILRFLLEARSVGGAVSLLLCDVKRLHSSELISFQVLKLRFGVSKHTHVLLASMLADFRTVLDRICDNSLPVLVCFHQQLSGCL